MLSITCSPGVYAADCGMSQKYFNKGLHAGKSEDWTAVKEWLEKSVAECNIFENWYLLGQAEQNLGNMQAASSAFEDARNYAKTDEQRALAIARYAQVQADQGEIGRPLKLLHEARKMSPDAPAWITDLALNLDRKRIELPLTVATVKETLIKSARSIKTLNLDTKPSINVNIYFETASIDVVDTSLTSIDILAEVLSDKTFDGKQITIIGHSDIRGTDEYNYDLSERRAQKVLDIVISKKPKLDGRIKITGYGETQPLYDGSTEDVLLLNRRIEIQIDN